VTDDLVTALIPVKAYHPRFLREAVDSLLGQTSPRWRAMIVHMPGADSELEGVLGSAAQDPRITFIAGRGRRLAGALNTGMRAAETEFAAILLGDDLWEPTAVEVVGRQIAAAPEADFLHSSRRVVDDDGEPISSVYQARREITPEMFVEGGPVKHLLCWRVDLALAIGGVDESLNSIGVDDYDFPWSMMEAGARFHAIPECLYVYRDHRSGYRLTTHIPLNTQLSEIGRILRKHGVPEAAIERRLAEVRGTYLRQCLYSSRIDAWFKRLLRDDPTRGWRETYR
jgi:glycosyltransferase involved in cell wall biosynthesis